MEPTHPLRRTAFIENLWQHLRVKDVMRGSGSITTVLKPDGFHDSGDWCDKRTDRAHSQNSLFQVSYQGRHGGHEYSGRRFRDRAEERKSISAWYRVLGLRVRHIVGPREMLANFSRDVLGSGVFRTSLFSLELAYLLVITMIWDRVGSTSRSRDDRFAPYALRRRALRRHALRRHALRRHTRLAATRDTPAKSSSTEFFSHHRGTESPGVSA